MKARDGYDTFAGNFTDYKKGDTVLRGYEDGSVSPRWQILESISPWGKWRDLNKIEADTMNEFFDEIVELIR